MGARNEGFVKLMDCWKWVDDETPFGGVMLVGFGV